MDLVDVFGRSGPPPHPNILDIPTPPLQRAAVVIILLFPALSTIFFAMRAYIRTSMNQLGWDDFLCGMALLFSLLMTGPLLMFCKLNYFGWRAVDVPEFDPRPGFWWNFLVQMFYNPVLALVKASILFFLLRLGGHRDSTRWAIYALNIFNAAHAIAVFFTALFQCHPIAANWDFSLRMVEGNGCIDNSFHIIASCLTLLTDVLILGLPFWIFLGLNMPKVAKVAIIGVFLLGSLVTIIGIIRVIDIYGLFFGKPDPTKDHFHSITIVYATVEVNVAILSATIPTLRPLFRQWFPSLFGGTSANTSRNRYYGSGYGSRNRGMQPLDSRSRSNAGGNNNDITLKTIGSARVHNTEITHGSPGTSEEEIIRYPGIVRTTDVSIEYDNQSTKNGP